MARRIRAILESPHSSLPRLKLQYPEMILWVLMIGGICGDPTTEQAWFAGLLADFCLELGVCGGVEIAAMLADFFWSEFYQSPMAIGFWSGVARKQGFEGKYGVKRLRDHSSVAMFNVLG